MERDWFKLYRALIALLLHCGICCCNERISPQVLLKFHLISSLSSTGLPIRCQEPTAASPTQREIWPEDCHLQFVLLACCFSNNSLVMICYKAFYYSSFLASIIAEQHCVCVSVDMKYDIVWLDIGAKTSPFNKWYRAAVPNLFQLRAHLKLFLRPTFNHKQYGG